MIFAYEFVAEIRTLSKFIQHRFSQFTFKLCQNIDRVFYGVCSLAKQVKHTKEGKS
jgi:hypothetical protein